MANCVGLYTSRECYPWTKVQVTIIITNELCLLRTDRTQGRKFYKRTTSGIHFMNCAGGEAKGKHLKCLGRGENEGRVRFC